MAATVMNTSASSGAMPHEAWERLYGSCGLVQCLTSAEVLPCRGVCKSWRRLAYGGVGPEELWHQDPGSARRAFAWRQLLLGGISLQPRTPQDFYEKLCQTQSAYDNAIKRDVHRTLPQEELFREKNGKGQSALFRLLRALSIRLWDVGYCQSLNFIVATLIGVFPEDEALVFHCTLAMLLRHSLVDLYRPKFQKLGIIIWQFDRIVEGFLPKVHAVLQKNGVNSEYYAIQWFLTLFASDLEQHVVRRVWDRFLVAGWQVVVQVSLALLYRIQDVLPTMDNCHVLTYLKRFVRTTTYEAEELLRTASSFNVSHQMLSALEAAYNWNSDVQLFVIKDLNSGRVHWSVQAVPHASKSSLSDDSIDPEATVPLPRAFSRGQMPNGNGAQPGCCTTAPAVGAAATAATDESRRTNEVEPDAEQPQGTVLPFLLHNLDTGETTVMEKAWSQYTHEMNSKAQPLVKTPTSPKVEAAPFSPMRRRESSGGSFWMQSMQRQAVRRLSQV